MSAARPDSATGNHAPARDAGATSTDQHPSAALVGPCYGGAALSRWLGISEDTIGDRAQAHALLGCRASSGRWYSALQFDDHGHTIAGVEEVVELLLGGSDEDRRSRAARWLAAPAPYLPGAVSAAQWLGHGGDSAPVLAAARADAHRWAH